MRSGSLVFWACGFIPVGIEVAGTDSLLVWTRRCIGLGWLGCEDALAEAGWNLKCVLALNALLPTGLDLVGQGGLLFDASMATWLGLFRRLHAIWFWSFVADLGLGVMASSVLPVQSSF